MFRTIAITALLFASVVSLGGAGDDTPITIAQEATAAPDFCETFKDVRNTVTGVDDDSCPHGPTP